MRERNRGRLLDVSQAFLKQLGHLACGSEAILGLLRHQLGDNATQPVGDVGVDLANGSRFVIGDPPQHSVAGLGTERRVAGTHRVDHRRPD